MNNFGIVIICFKNVTGVERLLKSLDNVLFDDGDSVKLIFSIDYSGEDDVKKLADSYEWKHGEKIIVDHKRNLGLRRHILSCGDYFDLYNLSAMIVLEDDIFVSPMMYSFAKNAYLFYKDDPKIAGISLYKHEYNINAKHPFFEYNDGGDTFFVQYAMSWGQIWIREKWRAFKKWYESSGWESLDTRYVPANLLKWKNSWLKFHILYCISNDLYFVYPRISLSTNFTDVGAHNSRPITSMQVNICVEKKEAWSFLKFEDSKSVYDAFFENKKLQDFLSLDGLEIDLFGVKNLRKSTKYVLTRRKMNYRIIKSWGLCLRPIELNVFFDIEGHDLYLYDLSEKRKNRSKNKNKFFEYDLKGLDIVSPKTISYCLGEICMRIKQKIASIKKKRKQ